MNTPPPYEPFDRHVFVPATAEQRAAFIPQYAEIYDKIAVAADDVAGLEAALVETQKELTAAVEVCRAVEHVIATSYKPRTFMQEWQANRSNR